MGGTAGTSVGTHIPYVMGYSRSVVFNESKGNGVDMTRELKRLEGEWGRLETNQ